MKKRKLAVLILGLAVVASITSCGGNDNPDTSKPPVIQPGDNTNTETVELASYKSAALLQLDELVNPAIVKISYEELKVAIQNYYDVEKQYINNIKDLETAKVAPTKVTEDTKTFTRNTFKPLVVDQLNSIFNPIITKIKNDELKTSVQNFYDTEITKLSAIETLDEISALFKEIIDDTKKFISLETEKVLIALKNKALEGLNPYVTELINKIPFDSLKNDTQIFYNEEKKKLEAIDEIEDITPCVNEIKEDLKNYALNETKKLAVSKFKEVVDKGLDKIPNPSLKENLIEFSNKEIIKINAITAIEDIPTVLSTVISEAEIYIQGILINTVKEYFARLTAVETATAYDYLPIAMHPSFAGNLVSAANINYNFTSNTNVSSISHAGFGEQWQMIVENIDQSVAMAKVFNVAQTVLNAAGNAVDIYITNSYAEEISYIFSGNGYTGKFEFKDSKLVFNITLTESITVPGFGSVKPVIKMEYELAKEAKSIFISLGDSYKVKYVITDNGYEMATTYGLTIVGKAITRSAFLSIMRNDNKTTGHIYEYTTFEGSDKIKACADFYVENGYVSVVGNKSSGMVGFDGYINELYSANEGRLLGYEVREELIVVGVSGTYNTLWFNIWDIQGINSIKITDKSDSNNSGKSNVDVYINGSSTMLSPTYNSKFGIKTSRKYDIEYRIRYYYSYDSVNNRYVANAVQIPMMFIQEGENISSFSSDMLKDNNLDVSVSLSPTYLNKILDDNDTLIDIFIKNKDTMSSESIIAYLERCE